MKKVLMMLFAFTLVFLVACGTKVESVKISAASTEVEIGETIQLSAEVLPGGVEQGVTWSTAKAATATVDTTGKVKGIKAGKVAITATSVADPSISAKVTITVKKAAAGGEEIDLGGYEIVVAYSPNSLYEMDPRLEWPTTNGTPNADREYRKAAFEKVEEELNCTITIKGYPVDTDSARWDYINQQATNGVTEFDIYWIPTKYLSNMYTGFIGLEDYYQEVCPGTMSTSDYFARVVKAQLFGWSYSSNSITSDDPVMAVNYGLLEEIGMLDQEPAKLYMDDKWSWTEFKQWVIDAQSALDSKYGTEDDKHYVLSGMLTDYVINMSRASGVALCDPLTGSINLTDQTVIDAANLMRELCELGCVDPANVPDAKSEGLFAQGKALIEYGTSYWVNWDNRWNPNRGITYAYSPFPYADNLSNTTNRFATYTQDTFVIPLAIDKKIEDSGIDSEDLTSKNIFKAWYLVYQYTQDLIEEAVKDGLYDKNAATLANAQKKWASDYSVEAWMSIQNRLATSASTAIFDPINELSNHWDGPYAKEVAKYINGTSQATDFTSAVTPYISDLQTTYTNKYK